MSIPFSRFSQSAPWSHVRPSLCNAQPLRAVVQAKCNRNVCLPKPPEAPCQSSACCPGQTKYSCVLSHNSGADDIGCGTQGVTCSTTVQCCLGFTCEAGQGVPIGIRACRGKRRTRRSAT